ncbi:MAG: ThiF family adenylyltransferase [Thermus sp.]
METPRRITIPQALLPQVLRQLDTHGTAFTPVGLSRHEGGVEWLARGPVGQERGGRGILWTRERAIPLPLAGEEMVLVRVDQEGLLAGYIYQDPFLHSVPIRLVAPGLPQEPPPSLSPPSQARSRVAGALGEGWGRLPGLQVLVAGAGRLGGLAAQLLLQGGVRRLVLVDPDGVMEENLDGGVFGPGDVGRPKVEALRDHLLRLDPGAEVVALPVGVEDLECLPRVKAADALVVATDWDRPRAALGAMAAAYLKPLLDLGTEVDREGRAGGEVRLLLPGEGCVVCMGGLAHPEEAGEERRPSRPWWEERGGSLPGLNALVAGLGVEALLGFLAGRGGRGLWVRVEWDGEGPRFSRPPWSPREGCLCGLAGVGDEGLGQAVDLVRNWHSSPPAGASS